MFADGSVSRISGRLVTLSPTTVLCTTVALRAGTAFASSIFWSSTLFVDAVMVTSLAPCAATISNTS